MRVRRCAALILEPRERLEFDLALLSGEDAGVRTVIEHVAIAPHLAVEVVLDAEESAVLASLSPSRWTGFDALARVHSRETLEALSGKGLLIAEGSALEARDQRVRDAHWRGVSAAMHYASRWQRVDTESVRQQFAETAEGSLLDHLGAAPPCVRERAPASARLALPNAAPTSLDTLLDRRVTCRNFDGGRLLDLESFASVLYRTFGARAVHDHAEGVQLIKKGVPSAGGLHPTEAYLLVQRVQGVPTGLYHYHPVDLALEPIQRLDADEAAALCRRFVAAQAYFVDAHVIVVPTSRFIRNFWKYRNHAKAYRALILDVGHLSQTMYLASTELGLAAFITAAINEVDIEQAFGLDALEEGPLAVCGFGIRAAERDELEFDPLNAAWPAA